jgi:hypothetical protein
MSQNSSFYENLLQEDFYQSSKKVASIEEGEISKNAARMVLSELSADHLEVLAEEIDNLFSKEAADTKPTLANAIEQGLAKTVDHKDEKGTQKDEEEKLEGKNEKKEKAVASPKSKAKKEAGKEIGAQAQKEDSDEDETEEDEREEENKETKETKETKEATEAIFEELAKYSEEDQDNIVKLAYEHVEEAFAQNGFDLFDYVSSRIDNEKVAEFITDKSEKLAYVSEKNSFQVADDIIQSIFEQMNSSEE